MRKAILLLIISSIAFSCNKKSKSVLSLTEENKKLKEELLSLKKEIDDLRFMPIFYPNKSDVELGNDYEAAFFIGVYNDKKPPLITYHDEKKPQIIDTLTYDENEKASIIRIKPKEKGHYRFFSEMSIFTIADTLVFPIKWEFDVN